MAKKLQQHPSRLVVTNGADRQHVHSQVGQIVDRVGSAARHHGAFAMLQDQHRSLARHARDFSIHEFVGHQVPQHRDGDLGEGFDNLPQPFDFLQMFRHRIARAVVSGQWS